MFAVALTMAALVLAGQQDVCRAQVSIHTDANTNSFSLKTPGLQQTFTRYYGAARTQPQPQEVEQTQQEQFAVQQQQEQEQEQVQFGGFSQYPSAYPQPTSPGALRGAGKLKADVQGISALQQQQQLQQQALRAQPGFGAAGLGAGAGAGAAAGVAGAINMPSYADQMHAAFVDYQRQRVEFEQQQQQLLQKLYHYYPDVSGAKIPSPVQPQAQQQQQPPAEGHQAFQGAAPLAANRFVYRRPQFASNGLQPGSDRLVGPGVGAAGPGSGPPLRTVGAGDFYSTQQHMGFMQQQHQDVLRDQQQSVAQQFATSQLAPTTRQTFGMAVPMSSVLSAPSYQPSPEVSHVSFSSGNLNYSF